MELHSAETQEAPGMAWSQIQFQDDIDWPEQHLPHSRLVSALLIAVLAVVVITVGWFGAAFIMHSGPTVPHDWPTVTPSTLEDQPDVPVPTVGPWDTSGIARALPQQANKIQPPEAATAPTMAMPQPDAEFLRLVEGNHGPDDWTVTDPTQAVQTGHRVCADMSNPPFPRPVDEADAISAKFDVPFANADSLVASAIVALCPQFEGK